MTFLQWCREVNIYLGLMTCAAICYRAVLGFYRHQIAYPPLFMEFAAAMCLVGIGSKVSQSINAPVTVVAAFWTGLLSLITLTALFYDPPRKDPVNA